uniref:FHA domain-containing protein n=1 Tax=Aegilops tauschii subsp. strangulata TaxID=200361 RepID=A0A453SD01_AEGTS
MELELEAGGGGSGGRVVSLSSESPTADLGRGDLVTADLNMSRRHVSLRLVGGGEPRVAFEVVGRNPVLVRSSVGGDKVYRRGEAGELRAGDGLSLSLKAPSFWTVRRTGGEEEAVAGAEVEVDTAVLDAVARREKRTRERKERERRATEEAMEVTKEEVMAASGDDELDEEVEDLKIDLDSIDPVQEFGFLSMGHEFDNYPKGRIRPPKDWNWFLEEIRKGSDDEDDDDVSNTGRKSRGRSGVNKKKKKREGEDDDEWTDESEDGKDSLLTGASVKRPKKYVTRSKDPKKPRKDNSKTENDDTMDEQDETDEDDEADETLGGFIVGEEDEPMEELSEEEEECDEFDDEDGDD